MSRPQARRELTEAMGKRIGNADRAATPVDKHPQAYKDVEQVMRDQNNLAEIQYSSPHL